jgi:hypothetical protein
MQPYRIPRRPFAQDNEEPRQPINWRRGIFRVWILVSASWIMGWVIYLLIQGIEGGAIERGLRMTPANLSVPIVLFGPPVALLIFGVGARWAFRGFNPDKQPPANSDNRLQ